MLWLHSWPHGWEYMCIPINDETYLLGAGVRPVTVMSPQHWRRRHSALARRSFAVYTVLIVYASLYPFVGWSSLGIAGPFDYLWEPMPRYLTAFDVVTNILGYLPFGALAVLALHPRWRGVTAALAASALGAVLAGTMEALQTYLPTRVASNLDFGANWLGALLGATLAAPIASMLLDRGILRWLRMTWFEREASTPLLLTALWLFAILFPQPLLFGIGDWPSMLWAQLDGTMRSTLLAWLPSGWAEKMELHWLRSMFFFINWEAVVTALAVFATLTLASLAMHRRAPRARLLCGVVVLALLLKACAAFLQSRVGLALNWATAAAGVGIVLGLAAALAALWLPAMVRAAVAASALALMLVLVNVLPIDPYFDWVLFSWRQGRYLRFNEIGRWLAWVWPYVALAWLALVVERTWLMRRRALGA